MADTPFDFRETMMLNSRVRGLPAPASAALPANDQLEGYDSCYLVKRSTAAETVTETAADMALCIRVSAPESGRVMEVWSTEPALQFYTGLAPQEPLPDGMGKGGHAYFQQHGLCFEPQGYPNAPNCPAFPSSVCVPGQGRAGRTVYRFSVSVLPWTRSVSVQRE